MLDPTLYLVQDAATNGGILANLLSALLDGVAYIMPVLVGILTVPLFDQLKKLIGWVDTMPPVLKQLAVAALAGVLTAAAKLINAELPTDVMLFGEADVSAWVSAAAAYGIYAGRKAGT